MPTVLRVGSYRFFFYSLEGNEPAHIHIERGDETAKFWLAPVDCAEAFGFRAHELRRLRLMVIEHRLVLMEAWDEYFNT